MSENIVTTDLSEFGKSQLLLASKLILALAEGNLPNGFIDENVQLMLNKNSGNVFLTNEYFDVAMFNNDRLEMWYTLPYSGEEGFKEYFDNIDLNKYNEYDRDYIENRIFGDDDDE